MRNGPPKVFLGLSDGMQRLLEADQRGFGCLEETLALLGQRHAAGGSVKQPNPQVLLQLTRAPCWPLAARFAAPPPLCSGYPAQRANEGGDGAQFVDRHHSLYSHRLVANDSAYMALV